ncbi:RHS repeat domain-containing protein [Rheinheimera marina]|uniref:RHS repeat domain-containing protein n=1 Tax=Rheinheimera marina TaxID=1774958 RepID=A0ABV9JI54_9GAMM
MLGSLFEKVTLPSGVVEHKFYFGDAVATRRTAGGDQVYYLHKDQQGSTTAITNPTGGIVQQFIYDPWGKQFEVTTTSLTYSSQAVSSGYTGHEMVNDFEVIHMGGRTYNPVLGRFMQADPFIQSPTNLQSYNRYSYVLNNPMSYTDPSGYIFKALNKAFGKFAPFVGFALMFINPIGAWATANWYQAAAFGFMSGGVATGSLRGAAVGAISGAAFQQVGASFKADKGFWAQGGAGHVGTHAVTGGITSVLGGGKFGHGFWSAGFTKGLDVNSLIPGVGDGLNAARAIVAALVGGTISELTGGKFANGAITAGLAQAVNGNSFWDDAEMLAEMAVDFMPGSALVSCASSNACSYTEWAIASAEVAAVVIPGGVAVRVAFKAFQKWKAASQVVRTGAESAKQAADLSKHLGYSQKYGQAGVKELENGRVRYYGELQSASKPGEMAGRRYVHEFDPATGRSRGWHETLDHSGNVRQIRPEMNNGSKTHYIFDRDGNYTGSW